MLPLAHHHVLEPPPPPPPLGPPPSVAPPLPDTPGTCPSTSTHRVSPSPVSSVPPCRPPPRPCQSASRPPPRVASHQPISESLLITEYATWFGPVQTCRGGGGGESEDEEHQRTRTRAEWRNQRTRSDKERQGAGDSSRWALPHVPYLEHLPQRIRGERAPAARAGSPCLAAPGARQCQMSISLSVCQLTPHWLFSS